MARKTPRDPAAAGDFMTPVLKSPGPTSRRVVDAAIRVLGRRDVGHAGTLDPFASGLLLVLAGRATKLVPYIHEWDKEYEAVIRLGVATDSLDVTGAVTARAEVPAAVAEAIPRAAAALTGTVRQMPPMLSAVRTGGERLHELARRGIEVERPVRTRTVHAFEIRGVELPDVRARISCSSGTYVRTLAEALGQSLGLPAHLLALHRTRIGPVTEARAIPDSRLAEMSPAEVRSFSIPLSDVLADWPRLPADAIEAEGVRVGRMPASFASRAGAAGRYRVIGPDGDLLALVERRVGESGIDFLRVFAGAGENA